MAATGSIKVINDILDEETKDIIGTFSNNMKEGNGSFNTISIPSSSSLSSYIDTKVRCDDYSYRLNSLMDTTETTHIPDSSKSMEPRKMSNLFNKYADPTVMTSGCISKKVGRPTMRFNPSISDNTHLSSTTDYILDIKISDPLQDDISFHIPEKILYFRDHSKNCVSFLDNETEELVNDGAKEIYIRKPNLEVNIGDEEINDILVPAFCNDLDTSDIRHIHTLSYSTIENPWHKYNRRTNSDSVYTNVIMSKSKRRGKKHMNKKPVNSLINSVNEVKNVNQKVTQDYGLFPNFPAVIELFTCDLRNANTNQPCLAQFSRTYDLTRHQNTIHAKRKAIFRCLQCINILGETGYQKTFSRMDALTRHIKSKHEGLSTEDRQKVTKYAKQNVGYIIG